MELINPKFSDVIQKDLNFLNIHYDSTQILNRKYLDNIASPAYPVIGSRYNPIYVVITPPGVSIACDGYLAHRDQCMWRKIDVNGQRIEQCTIVQLTMSGSYIPVATFEYSNGKPTVCPLNSTFHPVMHNLPIYDLQEHTICLPTFTLHEVYTLKENDKVVLQLTAAEVQSQIVTDQISWLISTGFYQIPSDISGNDYKILNIALAYTRDLENSYVVSLEHNILKPIFNHLLAADREAYNDVLNNNHDIDYYTDYITKMLHSQLSFRYFEDAIIHSSWNFYRSLYSSNTPCKSILTKEQRGTLLEIIVNDVRYAEIPLDIYRQLYVVKYKSQLITYFAKAQRRDILDIFRTCKPVRSSPLAKVITY